MQSKVLAHGELCHGVPEKLPSKVPINFSAKFAKIYDHTMNPEFALVKPWSGGRASN